MILTVTGFNHRTASVAQRSPFQLQRSELSQAMLRFQQIARADEAVIVATCNRIEFYTVNETRTDTIADVVDFYRGRKVPEADLFKEICYTHTGSSATRHLFRVASGIDSMILGEEQILGQVRHAYSTSCRAGTAGKLLHKLFHQAFRVAKRVRSETPLGEGVRSVPGAAVELLLAGLNTSRLNALVIGANETTAVVLDHLSRHSVPTILVNRTRAHAEDLVVDHPADVREWSDLKYAALQADLIFSATAAPDPVLTSTDLVERKQGGLLRIADLSVPRDIDPGIADLPDVDLYDLDRIQARLREVTKRRYEHLPEAQSLIEQQVQEFLDWLHAQLFAGGIDAVKDELHEIADEEMQRFSSAFHQSETKALEAFGHAMIKRFLKSATKHFEPLSAPLNEPPALKQDPADMEHVPCRVLREEQKTVETTKHTKNHETETKD